MNAKSQIHQRSDAPDRAPVSSRASRLFGNLARSFRAPPAPAGKIGERLLEGLAYVWRTPAVLLIMIVVAAIGTFGYNFSVVLPLLSGFVLHTNAAGYGGLSAFLGFGSLVGALLTNYNQRVRPIYRAARWRLGDLSARLADNLNGIRVIQAFAQQQRESIELEQVGRQLYDEQVRAVVIRNRVFPVIRWVANFGNVLMLGGGVLFIIRG